MAGTPNISVMPSLTIAETKAAGSKRGTSCTVAPAINEATRITEKPTMCDIGRTQYALSAGLRCAPITLALNSTLRWVSITPLGLPVVPDV